MMTPAVLGGHRLFQAPGDLAIATASVGREHV